MVWLGTFILLAIGLFMAASPLFARDRGMRVYGRVTKPALGLITGYYAAFGIAGLLLLKVCFGRVAWLGRRDEATGLVLAVLCGLAVLGPLVAVACLSLLDAAVRRRGHCAGCGYDLTGNTSGICPECGRPVHAADAGDAPPRLVAGWLRWRVVGPAWFLVTAVLFCVVGHVKIRLAYYCTECGKTEVRTRHHVHVPFVDACCGGFDGRTRPYPWDRNCLPDFLDATCDCDHRWQRFSWLTRGLTNTKTLEYPNPTFTSMDEKADFGAFLDENADMRERIRTSLRRREPLHHWLYDEYLAWQVRRAEVASEPVGPKRASGSLGWILREVTTRVEPEDGHD